MPWLTWFKNLFLQSRKDARLTAVEQGVDDVREEVRKLKGRVERMETVRRIVGEDR